MYMLLVTVVRPVLKSSFTCSLVDALLKPGGKKGGANKGQQR